MHKKFIKKTFILITLSLLATIFTTNIYAQVIYVDSASTAGLNNGTSWANAYTNFDSALVYSVAGDTLWVAKGTYQADSNTAFNLKSNVAVYGGFTGLETTLATRNWGINATILKGNNHPVIRNIGINATAILDGFTITGGIGILNSSHQTDGGGMYNQNSSPTLTNLTFLNNTASHDGGGMYNAGGSSPALNNVTFLNNTASVSGGGMANADSSSSKLSNVIFSDNTATDGAGIFNITTGSTTLTNVRFFNNTASAFGGGMDNNTSGLSTLTNVIFSNNTATFFGGGMYNSNDDSTILTNVIFSNNTASQNGGGLHNVGSSVTFINVTFSNNTASGGNGGGMDNINSSSPKLTNCVFWGNTDSGSGMPDIDNDSSSSSTVTYSFTQTAIAGTGNIQGIVDPFVDSAHPAGADNIFMTADDGLHILSTTAAYNAGNNAAVSSGTTTDITGMTARILDSIIEMGAYETALFTYTFTGSSNWSNASNWLGNQTPPSTLPSGSQIVIDPSGTNSCTLDTPESISLGSSIIVVTGKNFIVPGNLTVVQ